VQAIGCGCDRWLASSLALMGKNLVQERIVQFAEQTAIPTMFGMLLQVLPALWHQGEGRLR